MYPSDREYSDEEVDVYQQYLEEEKEFEEYWQELQKDKEDFINSGPSDVFQLLSETDYEKLINGEYISKKDYDSKKKEKENFPMIDFSNKPIVKTEEELIEEKKGWVTFKFQHPKCKQCRGCRKNRKCRNRGRKVETPLYPELFVEVPKSVKLPTPKTKLEQVAQEKKIIEYQTGNIWGENTVQIKSIQQIEEEAKIMEQKRKEEELRKQKEELERKKRAEELIRKREEERRRRQEHRMRRRPTTRNDSWKKNTRIKLKPRGGRFSRDNLN